MKKFHILKKIIIFTIVMPIVLSCVACTTNTSPYDSNDNNDTSSTTPPEVNTYELNIIDGNYYMKFDDYYVYYSSPVQDVSVDSIEELKEKIENHDFTDWDYRTIKSAFEKDENGTKIFNLNNIYKPILPEGMSVSKVDWNGESYSFFVNEQESIGGIISVLTQESFSYLYNSDYVQYFQNPNINITERRQLTEREAVETLFSTNVAQCRHLRYEMSTSNAVYYIDELYLLDIDDPRLLETSETVPLSVNVWCSSEEQSFFLRLDKLDCRPTLEWLLAFKLSPIN